MDTGRMVLLTTVPGAFHAQVLVARLGADGIVTQLRGAIGGPYPGLGEVDVLVPAGEYEEARALLLADAADGFAGGPDREASTPPELRRGAWLALAALALLVACSMLVVQALAARSG